MSRGSLAVTVGVQHVDVTARDAHQPGVPRTAARASCAAVVRRRDQAVGVAGVQSSAEALSKLHTDNRDFTPTVATSWWPGNHRRGTVGCGGFEGNGEAMIRVDRTRVPKPAVLDSPKALQERRLAEDFYRQEWSRDGPRTQRRFEFKLYREMEVREALTALFHGKCAYCEARFAAVDPPDIEQFRPKASVTESPEHPGYWWLASDWDNLLVSCLDCNRVRTHEGERVGKANRFPLVDERKRAWEPGQEAAEQPAAAGSVSRRAGGAPVVRRDGRVVSDTPRGQATISVLGLNRRWIARGTTWGRRPDPEHRLSCWRTSSRWTLREHVRRSPARWATCSA